MSCYHPLRGYVRRDLSDKTLTFSRSLGFTDRWYDIPCGKCIGCMEELSKSWAVRCVHESKQHDQNCFITLTYNDENLPDDFSVSKKEISDFMKKFRKSIAPKEVRFFGCGEYGGETHRPHYHIAIFGFDFIDKKAWKVRNGNPIYRSRFLESLWKKGFSGISDLNYHTAAYIARYTVKKLKMKDEVLEFVDYETGEVFEVEKEFGLMSRMPGIGKAWFDKYYGDCLKGFVFIDGKRFSVPKYYKLKLKEKSEGDYNKLVQRTYGYMKSQIEKGEFLLKRLSTKEDCKKVQFNYLKRKGIA